MIFLIKKFATGSYQFNSDNIKYTTLQRSTLIEFLKDDVYTQHLRFAKTLKKFQN